MFGVPSAPPPPVAVAYWSTYRFPQDIELNAGFSGYAYTAARGHIGQGFHRPLEHADTNMDVVSEFRGESGIDVRAVGWDISGGSIEDRLAIQEGIWGWEFTTTRLGGSPLTEFEFDFADDMSQEGKEEQAVLVDALRERGGGRRLYGRVSYNRSVLGMPYGNIHLPPYNLFRIWFTSFPKHVISGDTFIRFTIYGSQRRAVPVA